MAIYVHEFLFRGRAPVSDEPPAWHVILASEEMDGFGEVRRTEKILNMAQAAEMGWTLPKIVGEINGSAMSALEAAQAENADLKAQIAETLATAGAEIDAQRLAGAELAKRLDERNEEADDLRRRLEDARAQLAEPPAEPAASAPGTSDDAL